MNRILLIALASFATLASAGTLAQAADSSSVPGAAAVQVAAGLEVRPDDVVMGKADAPITVFEYASLTCPHCADFSTKTLPQVKKDWIDTGKVRWIYRDFPFDPVALKAHELAHCGGPDRMYGFLDVLYAQQRTWYRQNPDEAAAAMIPLMKMGGISDAQAKACLSDTKISNLVVTNRKSGDDNGVDSTPTFFINGTKSVGFMEYADFQKLLQAAK